MDDLETFSVLENIKWVDVGALTNYGVNDFILVELKTAKGEAVKYVTKIWKMALWYCRMKL